MSSVQLRRPHSYFYILRRTGIAPYSSCVPAEHNVRVSRLPRGYSIMRSTHFREILRDSDILFAIRPVVEKRNLSFVETRDVLLALQVPRATEIATLVTTR